MPPALLMPMVAMLCMIGAYSVQLSVFDMWVAIGFGIFGYLLVRYDFPLAPMVFALILGKIADENLRKSAIIFSENTTSQLLSRPIGLIILLLILVTILYGIVTTLKAKSRPAQDATDLNV